MVDIHFHMSIVAGHTKSGGIALENYTDEHADCIQLEQTCFEAALTLLGYEQQEEFELNDYTRSVEWLHPNGDVMLVSRWACQCPDGDRVTFERKARRAALHN